MQTVWFDFQLEICSYVVFTLLFGARLLWVSFSFTTHRRFAGFSKLLVTLVGLFWLEIVPAMIFVNTGLLERESDHVGGRFIRRIKKQILILI